LEHKGQRRRGNLLISWANTLLSTILATISIQKQCGDFSSVLKISIFSVLLMVSIDLL
jgi:hypothetical protein